MKKEVTIILSNIFPYICKSYNGSKLMLAAYKP